MKAISINNKYKIFVFFFCTIVTGLYSFAQTTFNSSGTFTTGAGVTCLRVQVWGAGGGGGGNSFNGAGGGAGG